MWDRNFVFISKVEDLKQVMIRKGSSFPKPPKFYDIFALYGDNILTLLGGDNWKQRRAICDPAFGIQYLGYLSQVSVESMDKLFERWDSKSKLDEPYFEINAEKETTDVTMEIIGLAEFGYNTIVTC